jgi:hypothetical protein
VKMRKTTRGVLEEVFEERRRQDARFGPQNHPDGTGPGYELEPSLDRIRRLNDGAVEYNELTWALILNEEVAEAFAEKDPANLRTELIQCAAICVAWCEALDRRGSK